MSTSATTSAALLRIAYAWGLALAPHALKIGMLAAAGYKWDNRLGRSNMARDPKELRVSPAALARARRTDAAHANGLEIFPLFAASVLSATVAGVDAESLDLYTKAFLVLRVVYTGVFILGGNQAMATLRTATWASSVYTCMALIFKAAKAYTAKGI